MLWQCALDEFGDVVECSAGCDRYCLEDVAVMEAVRGESDVKLRAVRNESVGVLVLAMQCEVVEFVFDAADGVNVVGVRGQGSFVMVPD